MEPMRLTHEGKTQTVGRWAEELKITEQALRYRIKRGLPPEELFRPKPKKQPNHCQGDKGRKVASKASKRPDSKKIKGLQWTLPWTLRTLQWTLVTREAISPILKTPTTLSRTSSKETIP